jgi:hypothetical protein
MPKVKMQCAGCGKEFETWPSWRVRKNVYCSRKCAGESRLGVPHKTENLGTVEVGNHRRVKMDHAACYLKEARAILSGRKSRINKCVRLAGDD